MRLTCTEGPRTEPDRILGRLDAGTNGTIMLAALYLGGLTAPVTERPAKTQPPAARRPLSGGARQASFGFELGERQALARRDPEVMARLFDACFERIHRYLARLVRDEHVVDDLVQETFLRLQKGLVTYDPERALQPWVFTVASNVLRDHFGARKLEALDVDELAGGPTEPSARGEAPSARLDRDECAQAAARALASLPEGTRAVVHLRHHEGLAFGEIASALGISEDTARQRHTRALVRLRTLLADFAPQAGESR
jgi:RNA polymerase sigma factor (sigma-70 family)